MEIREKKEPKLINVKKPKNSDIFQIRICLELNVNLKKNNKKTNKTQNQTNTVEVHAFIVVIISSSADCRTERTIVHEKHNSPKRTHLTYSQSQVLFIYSIFITFINVYDSCLDL